MRELDINNCDNNVLTFTMYASDEEEVNQFREAFFGGESAYHIEKLGYRQERTEENFGSHSFVVFTINDVDPDRFTDDGILVSFFKDNNIETVPSITWIPYVNAVNDAWTAYYADGAIQDKTVGMSFNVYSGE
jgi:hypothetical protein